MGYPAHLKKAPLVGAFFVSALCPLPALADCPVVTGLAPQAVERVVDGDTLRLADGRSVRLLGINAPELARGPRAAEPFAQKAREQLQALIRASGGVIGVQAGIPARDRYGRMLATVYDRQGHSLESQLLAQGLAYRVAFTPASDLEGCLEQAEGVARRARLGLWQARPLAPAALRRSGFALVQAQVRQVQRNGGGLWLDLDGPLVLRVEPARLRYFDEASLRRLPGRRIEVRGWIVDRAAHGEPPQGRARWMLSLTHQSMLEVLP